MKNHKMVGGKLLQTNKKWSHLTMKEKETIYNHLKELYIDFFNKNKRVPNKEDKKIISDELYSFIKDRDIWIPYGEVRKFLLSKTIKLNKMLLKNN